MTLAVACESAVTMNATAPLAHQCPYRDEADEGTVEITWTTAGATIELHALAAWIDGFKGDRVSHEDITADIRDHLDSLPGITDVRVRTRWGTAGVEVIVCSTSPTPPPLGCVQR